MESGRISSGHVPQTTVKQTACLRHKLSMSTQYVMTWHLVKHRPVTTDFLEHSMYVLTNAFVLGKFSSKEVDTPEHTTDVAQKFTLIFKHKTKGYSGSQDQ